MLKALPSILSFVDWIVPPIGVNLSGIDTANPNYKVSIMAASSSSSGLLILPFTELVTWNPASAPGRVVQYQLTSTLPGDPSSADYYETMVVTQSSPGNVIIRSRIFVTPQTTPFGSPAVTSSATPDTPAIIQVTGVVDSTNTAVNVYYQHFTVSDTFGPPDLFLQQPW